MNTRSMMVPLFVIAFAVILLGLVWGSGFLIPLFIAVLVWNILSAIVEGFERLFLPRWLAMVLSILLVGLIGTFVFHVIAGQIDAVSAAWPNYVKRFEELLSEAVSAVGPDVASRVRETMAQFDLTSSIRSFLGSAQTFLVGLLLVLLYSAFLFVEARHAPQKIRTIFGTGDGADDVAEILSHMSSSLRQYFGVKTVMSVLTGLGSYVVLRLVGLDFPETWAFLIFLLNYIPNIGSTIAVILPALLALVQFDEIWPFAVISIGLTGLQLTIGNIIEPMFLGRTLNLSPFIVIVSLVFWGTIWGVVGMFLAVPITVFILIVCRNIPQLRWIAVLLSNDGKL